MKSLIVVSLVVVLKVLGEVSLKHGIGEIGEIHPFQQPLALLEIALRTLFNPWVDLAMTSLLSHTLLYMTSLSWLDLSFMMPMTASCYVLNAVFAWLLLDEQIPATRWLGTLTIMVGVMLVGVSECSKSKQNVLNSSMRQRTRASSNQHKNREQKKVRL